MTIFLVLNIIGAAFVIVGVLAPLAWAIRTQFNDPVFSAAEPQRRRGLDRRRVSLARRPIHVDRRSAQRRTTRRGWGRGLPA